jgi:hypothetical protein
MAFKKIFVALAVLASAWCATGSNAGESPQSPEIALRAALESLRPKLANSEFGRPIYLASSETANGLKGDVHGILDYPVSAISAVLSKPDHWCDVLLVHVSNRACRIVTGRGGPVVELSVVRRHDQPIDKAFQLALAFRPVAVGANYFSAELSADSGPFGTSNYRIVIEAIALDAAKSFLHFGYSYEQTAVTRLATQAYFATFGRGKVGFTVLRKPASGVAELIGGMLGLVERNAMRYFLTVDAYLSSPGAGASDEFEKRLQHWFLATEKYPRQLHEVDWNTYLELKRADRQRRRI